jgi:hypothetical protein
MPIPPITREEKREDYWFDSARDAQGGSMACPDAIAVGYGNNTEGSPLAIRLNVGGTVYWFPAKCLVVESGSGSSAVITLEYYPQAGGAPQLQHVQYSSQGAGGRWYCTENIDPGAVARG